jgi:hypothetical protein
VGKKFLRVALVANTFSHLVCIACGMFKCEFAISNGVEGDEQAGIHKRCIPKVKAKRGA